MTTHSDNASTAVAWLVQSRFKKLEPHTGQKVKWYIGDKGRPGVVARLSGVDCYFSHGYIEKGRGGSSELRTKSAIERQILGSPDRLGSVLLWFCAHNHHAYFTEFEGRTLFGMPALEAERSSEYMLDQFGVWSPVGMLAVTVDSTFRRGWRDLDII